MDYDKEDTTNEIENEPDDKTVLIMTTQEGISILSHGICANAPILCCDSTKGFSIDRSSLGFVFTTSLTVTCMSIAGNGLCH